MSDKELDQISASALPSFENLEQLLNSILSLSLLDQAQGGISAISNVNAVNSAVVVQTNLAFAVNATGDISQSNTVSVINK